MTELGVLSLHEQQHDSALSHFIGALEHLRANGWPAAIAECIGGIAAAFAACAEVEGAARLLGAATSLRPTGNLFELFERPVFEQALAPVLEHLDEPEIGAAFAEGKAMRKADAIEYAIQVSRGIPTAPWHAPAGSLMPAGYTPTTFASYS